MHKIRYRVVVDHVGRLIMADPARASQRISDNVVHLMNRLDGRDSLSLEGLDADGEFDALTEMLSREPYVPRPARAMRSVHYLKTKYAPPRMGNKTTAPEVEAVKALGKGGHVIGLDGHEIDVLMSSIHARAPWMRDASTVALRGLRRTSETGVRVPPMILSGPPGTGKTSWAIDVARGLGVPVVRIAATARGVFALSGLESGWGNSQSGVVISEILRSGCANMVVVIDEIEKAPSGATTERGRAVPGIVETILDMSEASSSGDWTCPHLGVRFDLSKISWILTANDAGRLPAPLIDRFRVIEVPRPSLSEIVDMSYAMASGRVGDEVAAMIVEALVSADQRGLRPSLRTVERMIESAEGVLETPVLN